MAKPIEVTPTLYGDDAKRVFESLSVIASPEEMARRRAAAKKFAEMVTKLKPPI